MCTIKTWCKMCADNVAFIISAFANKQDKQLVAVLTFFTYGGGVDIMYSHSCDNLTKLVCGQNQRSGYRVAFHAQKRIHCRQVIIFSLYLELVCIVVNLLSASLFTRSHDLCMIWGLRQPCNGCVYVLSAIERTMQDPHPLLFWLTTLYSYHVQQGLSISRRASRSILKLEILPNKIRSPNHNLYCLLTILRATRMKSFYRVNSCFSQLKRHWQLSDESFA
jgi:hypothetical protein